MRKPFIILGAFLIFFIALHWIFTPKNSEGWSDSASAHGVINMDAVKNAFNKARTIPEFEKRLNEISEAENIVVVEMEKLDNGFELTAWEDLNGNGFDTESGVSSEDDDALFKITANSNCAKIVGLGVNSFYKSEICPYPGANQKTNAETLSHYRRGYYRPRYFWGYHRWGGPRYYTPYRDIGGIYRNRSSYRNSNQYVSQLGKNDQYISRMNNQSSASGITSNRKSYIRRKSNDKRFVKSLKSNSSASSFSRRNKLASTGKVKSGSSTGSKSVRSSSSFGSRFSSSFRGSSGFSV
jgi:hypothetical protein